MSHPIRLDHRTSGKDEAGELGRGLATGDLSAEYGRLDFIQKAVGSHWRNLSRRGPR